MPRLIRYPIVDNKKQCSCCEEWLELDKFYINRSSWNGYTTMCRECTLERKSILYDSQINREKTLRKYGLTQESFEELVLKQEGKCALCGISVEELEPRIEGENVLFVDHDHTSKKVRGLLCNGCNRLLGRVEPLGIKWLAKAILYLRKNGVE